MANDNFQPGWIPFGDRTSEQTNAHDSAVAKMSPFNLANADPSPPKRILLTDVWRHPLVKSALGFEFPRIHQLTGSCVGAGGGNALFTLIAWEVVRLNDPEQILLPFWLYTYGKSRERAGMFLPGSGSLGSTWAEAIIEDGIVEANFAGLPNFTVDDGVVYSSALEYQWSVGRRAGADVVNAAKKHVVKSAAPMKSVDDVITAIRNGYPCTFASDRYIGTGRSQGSQFPILTGTLDSRGGHQTSLQGVYDHPELGMHIWNQNNWPASAYPANPEPGCSACGVWQPADDLRKWIDSGDAECYALSQFQGFPAQTFSW